jgi:hypothetical protein
MKQIIKIDIKNKCDKHVLTKEYQNYYYRYQSYVAVFARLFLARSMDRRRGFSSGNNKRDRRGEQPEELEKRIPLPLAVLVCTRAAQRPRSHFETKTIFILALLHR